MTTATKPLSPIVGLEVFAPRAMNDPVKLYY